MRKPRTDLTLLQLMPRRAPRQLRSRILFDRIITTAKDLFEQHGFAHVTTNKIAEEANISIGSLYQYFTNCESIALAVYEQACAKAASTMKRRIFESLSLPFEMRIPKHIEWVLEIYEKDRYALLQLIYEVPELRRVSQHLSIGSLVSRTSEMVLGQHFSGVSSSVLARKAYILDKSVTGIISQYLEDRPDFLSRREAIGEMTDLVRNYLSGISQRARKKSAVRPKAAPQAMSTD